MFEFAKDFRLVPSRLNGVNMEFKFKITTFLYKFYSGSIYYGMPEYRETQIRTTTLYMGGPEKGRWGCDTAD